MALTSRLTEKMEELRHCVEQKRLKREEEENALHRAIDSLRSKHSKVESEKNLKESEVTQTKEEINKIKLDIVQVVYFFLQNIVIFILNLLKIFYF